MRNYNKKPLERGAFSVLGEGSGFHLAKRSEGRRKAVRRGAGGSDAMFYERAVVWLGKPRRTFSTEPIKKPENKYYLYSAFKSFR